MLGSFGHGSCQGLCFLGGDGRWEGQPPLHRFQAVRGLSPRPGGEGGMLAGRPPGDPSALLIFICERFPGCGQGNRTEVGRGEAQPSPPHPVPPRVMSRGAGALVVTPEVGSASGAPGVWAPVRTSSLPAPCLHAGPPRGPGVQAHRLSLAQPTLGHSPHSAMSFPDPVWGPRHEPCRRGQATQLRLA